MPSSRHRERERERELKERKSEQRREKKDERRREKLQRSASGGEVRHRSDRPAAAAAGGQHKPLAKRRSPAVVGRRIMKALPAVVLQRAEVPAKRCLSPVNLLSDDEEDEMDDAEQPGARSGSSGSRLQQQQLEQTEGEEAVRRASPTRHRRDRLPSKKRTASRAATQGEDSADDSSAAVDAELLPASSASSSLSPPAPARKSTASSSATAVASAPSPSIEREGTEATERRAGGSLRDFRLGLGHSIDDDDSDWPSQLPAKKRARLSPQQREAKTPLSSVSQPQAEELLQPISDTSEDESEAGEEAEEEEEEGSRAAAQTSSALDKAAVPDDFSLSESPDSSRPKLEPTSPAAAAAAPSSPPPLVPSLPPLVSQPPQPSSSPTLRPSPSLSAAAIAALAISPLPKRASLPRDRLVTPTRSVALRSLTPTPGASPPPDSSSPAPAHSQASGSRSTLPSAAAASSSSASPAASPASSFAAQRLYLVEAILDKRGTRHRAEYLVKWVGVEQTQWVPYAVVQAVDFHVWNKFNVAYKQKVSSRSWRRAQQPDTSSSSSPHSSSDKGSIDTEAQPAAASKEEREAL